MVAAERQEATASDGAASGANDRGILTWANGFTTLRLLCVPLFVILLAQPHRREWVAAAILLAALGGTDWVDGQLARRLKQVSDLGKVLDPTADRIMLVTAGVSLVAVGAVPLWVAALAIAREGLVGSSALYLRWRGAERIDVILFGKAGTFLMMVAMPLFLISHTHVFWHHVGGILAWTAVIPGLTLGWIAAGIYVPKARAAHARTRSRP